MSIPLSNPDITQAEIDAVVGVLRTPNLSLGPKLPEFEEKFARYIGTKYAVAVNSGTSALHLCMRALDIKDGDEVITSPFSFIASSNCILFERARPVFVDIREDTLNIDESKIKEKITGRTKAILPVHVFGYPADMEKITSIAGDRDLAVIEDACEAVGAQIGVSKVGTFSDCAVFAFYPNKQMTTGEGGMIVTNDEKIYSLCRSMRNQGRDDGMQWLGHNRLGYNYRISDINCALGIAQVKRLESILAKRSNVADLYKKALAALPQVKLPPASRKDMTRSWFVYVVQLEGISAAERDKVIERLKEAGIGASAYFPAIHLQPFYTEQFGFKTGDFPVCEKISEKTVALPFYNNLTEADIDTVVGKLGSILEEIK